jgi:hypothetical protein
MNIPPPPPYFFDIRVQLVALVLGLILIGFLPGLAFVVERIKRRRERKQSRQDGL